MESIIQLSYIIGTFFVWTCEIPQFAKILKTKNVESFSIAREISIYIAFWLLLLVYAYHGEPMAVLTMIGNIIMNTAKLILIYIFKERKTSLPKKVYHFIIF